MTLTTRIKQTYRSPLRKINAFVAHRRTDHIPSDTDINYSEALHILADDRRRHAIEYLASNPTGLQVPLSDLANVVAAQENDCSIEAVTSTQRERVYIALYQQHSEPLSKVAEVDTDRMVFSPTAETKRVWQAYTTFQQELTG